MRVRVRDSFCDEISSLSSLRKCAELEEMMTRNTNNILRGEVWLYQVENQKDRQKLFSQCMEKAPLIMYCMLTKFSHVATPILPLHGLLYHLWSNSENVNIKQLSDDINI